MTLTPATPHAVCALLARFGTLRAQPAADWTGEFALPEAVARFYAEIGPAGEDGPYALDGLILPMRGNDVRLPPLAGLWELQAGYRWHGLTGARLEAWPDAWLVVADQGGDPFIFDRASGAILHARHGEGAWDAEPLFTDLFQMALVLGTVAAVELEAGEDLHDADFEVRPPWRQTLRARIAPMLGERGADGVAALLGW